MDFLWIIALAQALAVGIFWLTGKIWLVSEIIGRDSDPHRFRLYLTGMAVMVPILIGGAIFEPMSG